VKYGPNHTISVSTQQANPAPIKLNLDAGTPIAANIKKTNAKMSNIRSMESSVDKPTTSKDNSSLVMYYRPHHYDLLLHPDWAVINLSLCPWVDPHSTARTATDPDNESTWKTVHGTRVMLPDGEKIFIPHEQEPPPQWILDRGKV
jgi:hypothetical protein